MLSAILSALILTQAFLSTALAAIRPGVTVLVHGFTSLDGTRNSPYQYWGGNNGENLTALLERFGSGLVWEYNPADGNYINVTHSTDASGQFRIPRGDWFPAFAGHQILLFDWRQGSDEPESGQAEAAADALFASLMKFRVDGEPIISVSPYAAVRPLHFVGHSRGTVVVSEAVQRLGRFNVRVHYVTYLDIHDFGQPLIDKDEDFHDPAVQVWENMDYVDAAYQQNPAIMCLVNPAGRPLEHISAGSLQRDLTTLTALRTELECALHKRPHSWIKEYYWGTVALNGGDTIQRPDNWYGTKGTGEGYGFDRWFGQGGFDQGPASGLTRVRCVTVTGVIPFVWNDNSGNDGGIPDRNDVPPVLFNGDFDLPDVDHGIEDGEETKSLAGWTYFGGGGSAFVERVLLTDPDNYFLVLRGNSLVAEHNRFFLPPEARELLFAMSVPSVPLFGTHKLIVRIGNREIGDFPVGETGEFEVRRVDLSEHTALLGGVNTLTFQLVTSGSPQTPEVRIDNINIVLDPTSWIHSIEREQTNWRVFWRSWPGGTFHLQSSSNLVNWVSIDNNDNPTTAGSFIVPHRSDPQVFFRGRVVPTR